MPHIHAFDIDIARLNAIVRRGREQSHRNYAVLTRRLRNKEVG
jgi:16S rRNA U1498 N3-methylase RsmE